MNETGARRRSINSTMQFAFAEQNNRRGTPNVQPSPNVQVRYRLCTMQSLLLSEVVASLLKNIQQQRGTFCFAVDSWCARFERKQLTLICFRETHLHDRHRPRHVLALATVIVSAPDRPDVVALVAPPAARTQLTRATICTYRVFRLALRRRISAVRLSATVQSLIVTWFWILAPVRAVDSLSSRSRQLKRPRMPFVL